MFPKPKALNIEDKSNPTVLELTVKSSDLLRDNA
jgi:hypothetical protein